jgi:predicted O-methyltransferase YrrM
MRDVYDIRKLPSSSEVAAAFLDAAHWEDSTAHLSNVYRTGVIFDVDGHREEINESCTQQSEGQILWYITRQLRPTLIIETGFGRGASAAFFLSALSPWHGKLISIDPYFRGWAGETGRTFVRQLGLEQNHVLLEVPSEIALPMHVAKKPAEKIKFAYIDGCHHFDSALIDFIYFDRMLEIGGVIGFDDAPAPAVWTVTSFIANNFPYRLHYATRRLVLCQKVAENNREWTHFRPFTASSKSDWALHQELPDQDVVPNATFGPDIGAGL